MENLKVTSVQKNAWNDEEVKLSSPQMDVIIHIKDPALHGQARIGDITDDMFVQHADDSQEYKDLLDASRKEVEDLKAQLSAALQPK